ncbi:MAG TPA: hypothetical protein DCY14_18675 [Anaerolineae bacterium]|jgi:hypothetical protein|nr:hypothetical protein [Anaerolineae bacterium]HRJ55308.1 polymer-forming cytoskeletal protein [Anaerolineales bacterium]
MKRKTNLIRILLLLALLILPTGSVYAQSPNGDVILFGQNYTLESGDTLNGSLAVIGGNVMIEEGATVNGDVAVIGGNISINGDIDGDIALIGGNMSVTSSIDGDIVIVGGQANLASTALVDGNIATIGGNVQKEPGAQVTGEITNNAPPTIDVPEVPDIPSPNTPNVPDPDVNVSFSNPFWEFMGAIGQAIIIAGIGMLLTLFLQPQLERTGDAISRQPFAAGGFGLLTVIVVPVAAVLMAITILLIPVSLLVVFLVMPAVWVFGMVALGQEVGDRFTRAINQSWAPVLSTGFGTFLLMLIVGFVELIPCVGWLPSFLVTLVGIGGVVMTWFGTRNPPGYLPTPITAEEIPPAS